VAQTNTPFPGSKAPPPQCRHRGFSHHQATAPSRARTARSLFSSAFFLTHPLHLLLSPPVCLRAGAWPSWTPCTAPLAWRAVHDEVCRDPL